MTFSVTVALSYSVQPYLAAAPLKRRIAELEAALAQAGVALPSVPK